MGGDGEDGAISRKGAGPKELAGAETNPKRRPNAFDCIVRTQRITLSARGLRPSLTGLEAPQPLFSISKMARVACLKNANCLPVKRSKSRR
jgi:hypothetical protein